MHFFKNNLMWCSLAFQLTACLIITVLLLFIMVTLTVVPLLIEKMKKKILDVNAAVVFKVLY